MTAQLRAKRSRKLTIAFFGSAALAAIVGCGTSPNLQPDNPILSTQPVLGFPTSTTAVTTTVAPSAADGSNLDACADGNCEIAIIGPVNIPLTGQGGGITKLSVTATTAEGIVFTTSSAGGTSNGNLNPGCTLTFYRNGGGSSCGGKQEPPQPKVGTLAIQVASVTEGTVILRLVSS